MLRFDMLAHLPNGIQEFVRISWLNLVLLLHIIGGLPAVLDGFILFGVVRRITHQPLNAFLLFLQSLP